MVPNSFAFLAFMAIVFIVYWAVQKQYKLQNWIILLSSYCFFSFIDWKMSVLLLLATVIFYGLGIGVEKYAETNEKMSSRLTTLGVVLGIGILVYFKYLNFFIDQFMDLLNLIGLHCDTLTFKIIMPLGISFFTFKLISYPIEVHRGHMPATKDFVAFASFVAFFPTILSGPIDRPNKFIPQLHQPRTFKSDEMMQALCRICWGLVMKMCIADRLDIYTSNIFNHIPQHNGFSILLACLLYPLQMYADFAGYSEMAIGIGKMLGLKVAENFDFPFFTRNTAEYWRKWHMSLTSWLTDYVFMPLNIAFRNLDKWGIWLAAFINIVLVGMWHGANWTFVVFGVYHGLLFLPLVLSGAFLKKKKLKLNKWNLPHFSDTMKMCLTYLLVAIGLVIFQAASVGDAFETFKGIGHAWNVPYSKDALLYSCFCLCFLVLHDFNHGLGCMKFLNKIPVIVKIICYIIFVTLFGVLNSSQFIYFQF